MKWSIRDQQYKAFLRNNNRITSLGLFETENEAAAIVDIAVSRQKKKESDKTYNLPQEGQRVAFSTFRISAEISIDR